MDLRCWAALLALGICIPGFASDGQKSQLSPLEIKPVPSAAQYARKHGIAIDSFEVAGDHEKPRLNDRVTALFTVQDDTGERQWLAEFIVAPLTEREAKSRPGTGAGIVSIFQSSLKTDTGHEFSFERVPVALEIRTHGPFTRGSAKETVQSTATSARVVATQDYLEHGLAPMAEIELRLRANGKRNPGISLMFRPKFSQEQMTATKARASEAGFTESDERIYAEAIYAIVQFGNLGFKTNGIDLIVREMVDSPTLFSGAFTNLVWPELQLEQAESWGLPNLPLYRVPYNFLSKTTAHGLFYFTKAQPPLRNLAGFVGMTVDATSKAPGKRLVMRVIACRRGTP